MVFDHIRKLWKRLDIWTLHKFGRVGEIDEVLRRTRGKYLDPEGVAQIEGISQAKAAEMLEKAVERGILVKLYLYTSASTPAPVVVRVDEIGKTFTLSDLGFEEPDPEKEVTLSKFDVKGIYVSPRALN